MSHDDTKNSRAFGFAKSSVFRFLRQLFVFSFQKHHSPRAVLRATLTRRCCLCLQCRTALFPSGRCDCGVDSEVACFEQSEEREKIVAAVWGDPTKRARLERFVERTSRRVTGASVGGFFAGIAMTLPTVGVGPAMALFGTLGCLAGGALATHRSRLGRFDPQGAQPLPSTEAVGMRAKLAGPHELVSPAGGHECLAYCLELRVFCAGQEQVVYRDAVTSGFTTTLGSGQELQVPRGLLRFAGLAPEILDVDNLELEAFLAEVDPLQASCEPLNPLHYDLVREEVLFAGDDVDLFGRFEPVALQEEPSLYRDSVHTQLRPTGMVEVRRVR